MSVSLQGMAGFNAVFFFSKTGFPAKTKELSLPFYLLIARLRKIVTTLRINGKLRKLPHPGWRCPRGVMVKALDCGIVVSEFELNSRY